MQKRYTYTGESPVVIFKEKSPTIDEQMANAQLMIERDKALTIYFSNPSQSDKLVVVCGENGPLERLQADRFTGGKYLFLDTQEARDWGVIPPDDQLMIMVDSYRENVKDFPESMSFRCSDLVLGSKHRLGKEKIPRSERIPHMQRAGGITPSRKGRP